MIFGAVLVMIPAARASSREMAAPHAAMRTALKYQTRPEGDTVSELLAGHTRWRQ